MTTISSQLTMAAQGATYAYGPNDPRTIELNNAGDILTKAQIASSEAIIAAIQGGVSIIDALAIGDAAAQAYIAQNGPQQGLSEATQDLVATNFQAQSDFLKDLGKAPITEFYAYNEALASENEARQQQSFKDIVTDYVTALDVVETSIVTGEPLPLAQIVDDQLVVPERVVTVTPDIVEVPPVVLPPPVPPTTIIDVLPPPVPPVVLPPPVPPTTIVDVFPRPKEPAASNALLYGAGALALLLLLRRS